MVYASLSGSDYFHLLIDRKMKRFGMTGNISRIHFEIEEQSDLDAIARSILQNEVFQSVCSVRYCLRWPLIPNWINTSNKKQNVSISSNLSENAFQSEVLNRKVDNEIGLVFVDLCQLQDGSKHMVVSMHHALFDHQGMMNFIHALNGDFHGPLFRKSEPSSWWRMMMNGAVMNYDLFKRSVWEFGSLFQEKQPSKITPRYTCLSFSEKEKQLITQNAWKAGARIGESAFHVSVVAQALQKLFEERSQASPNLWFSVPHNQRRIGSQGHLLSNKLSFLFFKLGEQQLKSTSDAVSSIMVQLKQQVKFRVADKYVDMMKVMRFIPMPLYAAMVGVPSKGKLSSFGYSDLGDDKLTMSKIAGAGIKGVFRYPPVPAPPGFNVAALKKENGFELIIGSAEELVSEQEMEKVVSRIREGLLSVQ